MPLQVTRYMKSRTCLHNFITTVKYLFKQVFGLIFLCHANMRLNTTHALSAYLVLPMAYVHQWRSRSISRKEPWRHFSRHKALLQMLRTNSCLDKMSFAWRTFTERGMMSGSTSSYTAIVLRGEQPAVPVEADQEDGSNDMGPTSGPKVLSSIELACTPRKLLFFSLPLTH